MKRIRKAPKSLFGLWADGAATAMATVTTLAIRVPQLMTGTMSTAESRRMVGEKIAAAQDGIVKAALATGRIAARGPKRRADGGLHADMLSIIEAGTGPARRTVEANARRLSKPHRGEAG